MVKLGFSLVAATVLCACVSYPAAPSATAQLVATRGNAVTGTVTFTKVGDKVLVAGDIRGLTPNQEHGFHIHEKGDCSTGDGVSAGGHSTRPPNPTVPMATVSTMPATWLV
jgi:Cu-Zn family superoxide dismutase